MAIIIKIHKENIKSSIFPICLHLRDITIKAKLIENKTIPIKKRTNIQSHPKTYPLLVIENIVFSQLLFYLQFPFIILVCPIFFAPIATPVIPASRIYSFPARIWLTMFLPVLNGFI